MSVATAEIVDVGMLPISKSEPKETTVRYNARSILEAFASVKDNSQTRLIVGLALSGMSCQEYDMIEKEAAKMADTIDQTSGFVASKERRYGPKRNSLNTQASERRQVFGALKHGGLSVLIQNMPDSGVVNYDVLPAWAEARANARQYLKDKGIDWQGVANDDKRRQREQKQETAAWKQARDMAEQQFPQESGETIADWQARIAPHIKDIEGEQSDKMRAEMIQKKAKGLFMELGVSVTLDLVDELNRLVRESAAAQPAPF